MAGIRDIAQTAGVTDKEVHAVIQAIKTLTGGGEKVGIHKFGTFEIKATAARKGRNPKTNEVIQIPAGLRFAFKASKATKE